MRLEVVMDNLRRGGLRTTVGDLMTRPVRTVSMGAGFKEVVAILLRGAASAVPVVDDDDRMVGIISETDLLLKERGLDDQGRHLFRSKAHLVERSKAQGTVAAELMNWPVVTAHPELPVQEAARLMLEKGVNQLPVVDADDCLLGIVSRGDLLRVFLRDDETLRCLIRDEVIEEQLWMDPTAIAVEVADGVVSLSGEVSRRSGITVLLRAVASVPGVVDARDAGLSYRFDDIRHRVGRRRERPVTAPARR
jgi:CBS-domain-containing membrane protein